MTRIILATSLLLASIGCDRTPQTGEDVLANYLEALGGKAAFEEIKTRHEVIRQTYDQTDDTVLVVVDTDRERGVYVLSEYPNRAQTLAGFCRDVAWSLDGQGPRVMTGSEREWLRHLSFIEPQISVGELFSDIAFVGRTTFNGEDCYHLKFTTTGGLSYDAYFLVDSSLLFARQFPQMGESPVAMTRYYRDYREKDGIKSPYHIESHFKNLDDGSEVVRTSRMTTVTYNNELPDQYFELPEPIENLVDLPNAQDLIDQHIQSIGGIEAIRGIKSRREIMRTTFYHSPEYWAETVDEITTGQRHLIKVNTSDGVKYQSGYDGTHAWSIKNGEAMLLSGQPAEEAALFAWLAPILEIKQQFKKCTTLRRVDFKGMDAYEIEVVADSGWKFYMFYDIEKKLIRGFRFDGTVDGDPRLTERLLGDHRVINGVMIPHEATAWHTLKAQNQTMISSTKTMEIEVNVAFPDGHFEMPAQVKDLISNQSASPAP